MNAEDRNTKMRSPSNQDSSGNNAGTNMKEGVAAPIKKTPIAGGRGARMGSSDDLATALKTAELRTAATQTFGRPDDAQGPNAAAKKTDEDSPDEQATGSQGPFEDPSDAVVASEPSVGQTTRNVNPSAEKSSPPFENGVVDGPAPTNPPETQADAKRDATPDQKSALVSSDQSSDE